MQFKACGIRRVSDLNEEILGNVNLFGINFSPLSKRRPKSSDLEGVLGFIPKEKQVFVFKENGLNEILDHLNKFKPKYVQIYDSSIINQLPNNVKIIYAAQLVNKNDVDRIQKIKGFDYLLIEGAGSGEGVEVESSFDLDQINIPFWIAGGLNEFNVESKTTRFKNCIGGDVASGIEVNGDISKQKINSISKTIKRISEANDHKYPQY